MAGEWLPPTAPEGRPSPSEPPTTSGWAPPAHAPSTRPTFVVQGPAAKGPRNGMAVAALVCGIVGLVLLVLSLGLWFVVAVPVSAAAMSCARVARRRLARGQASTGAGQAKAGFVLGAIGVVLGIVAAIVWIVLLANGLSLEELQRDLERELERQRDRPEADAVEALVSLWRA